MGGCRPVRGPVAIELCDHELTAPVPDEIQPAWLAGQCTGHWWAPYRHPRQRYTVQRCAEHVAHGKWALLSATHSI